MCQIQVDRFIRGALKLQDLKLTISLLAKLEYFCTQKKFNAFTFSQAQTSLRGEPIREFHLLWLTNSTINRAQLWVTIALCLEFVSYRSGRLSIGPPLRTVWTFFSWTHFFFECKQSNLLIQTYMSCWAKDLHALLCLMNAWVFLVFRFVQLLRVVGSISVT